MWSGKGWSDILHRKIVLGCVADSKTCPITSFGKAPCITTLAVIQIFALVSQSLKVKLAACGEGSVQLRLSGGEVAFSL